MPLGQAAPAHAGHDAADVFQPLASKNRATQVGCTQNGPGQSGGGGEMVSHGLGRTAGHWAALVVAQVADKGGHVNAQGATRGAQAVRGAG